MQDLSWDYIHANRQVYVDLTGVAEFLGTWRYCVGKVDRDMKEALGALFVRDHFSESNKRTASRFLCSYRLVLQLCNYRLAFQRIEQGEDHQSFLSFFLLFSAR